MSLRSHTQIRGGNSTHRAGLALAVALLLLSLFTLGGQPVRAAVNLSPVGFSCGYDAETNTFTPTATIQRFGAESIDLGAAVAFRLFDQDNLLVQLGQLGSGVTDDGVDVHGEFPVALGGTRTFTPELASFGDGVGSPPLIPNHNYVINLGLTDWSQEGGGTDFGLAPGGVCTTAETTTCQKVVQVYVNHYGNVTDFVAQLEAVQDSAGNPCLNVVRLSGSGKFTTDLSGSIMGKKNKQPNVACGTSPDGSTWYYNEMHGLSDTFPHTVDQDQRAVAACSAMSPGTTDGIALAAVSAWEEGGTSLTDRAGATAVTYFLLELYNSAANRSVGSWPSFLGTADFKGMINVTSPGDTDAHVASLVRQLCEADDVLGLYRGSKGIWESARQQLIVDALYECTVGS